MSVEIIRGMPEREYRARPEISQSQLKAFRLPTPAHAEHDLATPSDEDKDCLIAGHALHSIILENRVIHAAMPECDGRTKEGKAIKAAFHAANEGKLIVSFALGAMIDGMAAGIMRNGEARAVLADRLETEVSIFWDGMKARLDAVCPLGVIDLKSCRKLLTARNFSAQIEEFGYHIQAAHYLEAAAVAGLPCEDFRFICVENFPPFCCRVFRLSHLSIEIGKIELERLRKLYFECKESGDYPGYPEVDQEIELPGWKLREEGEE